MRMTKVPNPGSDEAVARGCKCPIMDNNHGKWVPWYGDWIISENCRLHWPEGSTVGEG